VDKPAAAWKQRLRETLAVLRRAKPSNKPTPEDIARLHELHARHEREAGRDERAEEAEERAKRVRATTRDSARGRVERARGRARRCLPARGLCSRSR